MDDRRRRKNKAKKHQHRPPPYNNITSSTEELSSDILLFHILPRLPVHSLRRFRFLSKQCYSHITTPLFAKMQLHHQNQNQNQNHHKFLGLSDTTFRTIDCENPNKYIVCAITNRRIMSKRVIYDCEVPNKDYFSVIEPFPFKVVDHYDLSAVTSFHGMVCIALIKHSDDEYYDNLIIWNPVTGEYKILSKTGSHKECYYIHDGLFQLYYSSSDDDYKLLRITCDPDVYIYSLKSDSWRKVDYLTEVELTEFEIQPADFYEDDWKPSITAFLNEKLYFLNQVYDRRILYSVISFDTKTEKFTQIAAPFLEKIRDSSLSFFVLRGCIHLLCVNKYYWPFELWRMEGDGDWTKVVSGFPWCLDPLQLMRIKYWLRHSESDDDLASPNRYACLDESSSTLDMKKHTGKSWYILEYMETVVSPNQYTK